MLWRSVGTLWPLGDSMELIRLSVLHIVPVGVYAGSQSTEQDGRVFCCVAAPGRYFYMQYFLSASVLYRVLPCRRASDDPGADSCIENVVFICFCSLLFVSLTFVIARMRGE